MRVTLLRLLAAAALYGFAIGAVRSWRFALLNLVKFPLLVFVTAAVCAASYYLVARFTAPQLRIRDVGTLVLSSYADTAVLLASLAGVCLFLAVTMEQPRSLQDLGDYPLVFTLNVLFVATCGSIALVRQGKALLRDHDVARGRSAMVVLLWLALSLLVGGQTAWYLRPFVGIRAVPDDGSFCHGARPDPRGATSFYQAVYHALDPPRMLPRLQNTGRATPLEGELRRPEAQ